MMQASCREIVFVDSAVKDPQLVFAGSKPGIETILVSNAEADRINLSSISTDLRLPGAISNSIQCVEVISAAFTTAGVTTPLRGRTEAVVVAGSGFADNNGGGTGALQGGTGNVLVYGVNDVSFGGSAGTNTLLFNETANANFSLLDQSIGHTANVSDFENVSGSGSSAAISLTGSSTGANIMIGGNDTIDGGAATTTVFSATADYTITLSSITYTATDNAGGPNKIVLENLKQGNPISECEIEGDGDASIQGFATEISTNIGQTVDFKIATDSNQGLTVAFRPQLAG